MKLLVAVPAILLFVEQIACFPVNQHLNQKRNLEVIKHSFKDLRGQEQYVEVFNQIRTDLAEKYGLTNMQPLTWNQEWADAIGQLTDCTPKHGADYRQADMNDEHVDIENLLKALIPEGSDLGAAELYIPKRSHFGCAVPECGEVICNIGPGNTWSYADIELTKKRSVE